MRIRLRERYINIYTKPNPATQEREVTYVRSQDEGRMSPRGPFSPWKPGTWDQAVDFILKQLEKDRKWFSNEPKRRRKEKRDASRRRMLQGDIETFVHNEPVVLIEIYGRVFNNTPGDADVQVLQAILKYESQE